VLSKPPRTRILNICSVVVSAARPWRITSTHGATPELRAVKGAASEASPGRTWVYRRKSKLKAKLDSGPSWFIFKRCNQARSALGQPGVIPG